VVLPGAAAVGGDVPLAGLRVALQLENGLDAPSPATAAAVRAAAEALRARGAAVTEAAIPAGGHELTIEVWRSYGEGDAPGLWRLLRRWDAFRSAMLGFAATYDLVVCPVFPDPARPHGGMHVPGRLDPTSWTTSFSLAGWPAATVRAGTSPEGLPIGVQLAAGPRRDDVALAAAAAVEAELGPWPDPPL
jgi:amidase